MSSTSSSNSPSSSETDRWQLALEAAIDQRNDQVVALRRHLHAYPEVSGEEHQTSQYLYQLLDDEKFVLRIGPDGRGVIVDPPRGSRVEGAVGRVALRGDIDALRIHDEKHVAYRSTNPGVMHACGHDAHTAMLFAALTSLRQLEADGDLPWPVNYRGIFQPAEETIMGAAEMIAAGAIDEVDAIFATHVDPTRPMGRLGIREGVLTANCNSMHITITGRGGHAARPHETIDPIATAAQLISSIYLFVPRAIDSQDAVVVTIGQIRGGENPNVIPEQVEMRGTMRSLRNRVRDQTMEHITQICHGLSETSGTQIEVAYETGIPSVKNDVELTAILRHAMSDQLGEEAIDEVPRPSMGSEDFASYLDHIPGAMFRLGTAMKGAEPTPLHTPNFDIDERALAIGAKILARSAVLWSNPNRSKDPPD